MSVLAFDGTYFAADRMMVNSGYCHPCEKLFKTVRNGVEYYYGFTGNYDAFAELIAFYFYGEPWPEFQKSDKWTRLFVVRKGALGDVAAFEYQQSPKPIELPVAVPIAFGAGRDYAIGAMLAGKDAREAVRLTNLVADSCGFGVRWFNVHTGDMGLIEGGK